VFDPWSLLEEVVRCGGLAAEVFLAALVGACGGESLGPRSFELERFGLLIGVSFVSGRP